jgi:hypothetical protein
MKVAHQSQPMRLPSFSASYSPGYTIGMPNFLHSGSFPKYAKGITALTAFAN